MTEKRKFNRYSCNIKTRFEFYEGDPDTIDVDISVPNKGKGIILDISQGGLFIVTNERVSINMPLRIICKIKNSKFNRLGKIVRTGLLEQNPSEVAKKFSRFSAKGDSYIAVEFDLPLDNLSEEDI